MIIICITQVVLIDRKSMYVPTVIIRWSHLEIRTMSSAALNVSEKTTWLAFKWCFAQVKIFDAVFTKQFSKS